VRDPDHLKDLLAYCAWADATVLRSWGASPGREDPEMRERVRHAVETQRFLLLQILGEDDLPWDKILSGEVPPPWRDRPLPEFEELRATCRKNHADLAEMAAGLDVAGLQRTVRIPWFRNPPCDIPVAEVVVQIVMHTQHHRGQQMTRLKALGGKLTDVDYIIWAWQGRPRVEWE
jgi:uncharacterized damage-inducible protein DinB